jgi:hypothetical protein
MEGVVSSFNGTTYTFNLENLSVVANATLAAGLADDSRVEVEGTLKGTTLTATKIDLKPTEADLTEQKGLVTAFDATAKTFTVGGMTFKVLPTTIFNDDLKKWTGSNPVSTMATTDNIVVKYYIDKKATPNVNVAVKVERQ